MDKVKRFISEHYIELIVLVILLVITAGLSPRMTLTQNINSVLIAFGMVSIWIMGQGLIRRIYKGQDK